MLSTINQNIAMLMAKVGTSEQPSVRPKEKKDEDVGKPPATAKETGSSDDDDIVEIKNRKGIFFSSSIGLQCDLVDLQERLESEIYAVKTFHIERHPEAQDVEMYLRKNLEEIDQTETKTDFIIISVGTNDITKLELTQDIGDLNNAACEHSKFR